MTALTTEEERTGRRSPGLLLFVSTPLRSGSGAQLRNLASSTPTAAPSPLLPNTGAAHTLSRVLKLKPGRAATDFPCNSRDRSSAKRKKPEEATAAFHLHEYQPDGFTRQLCPGGKTAGQQKRNVTALEC
ncbi:UNVERIFIED_CONTAM: hypothetical protein FKN15_075627 [Acipenser sinensis]